MARLSVRADNGVGSITLSPSGRDVALASRSGLYVLDLQSPFTPPRWLPLFSAWEVANCQWCPHPQRPTWVMSTCNHKAVVWNLALPSDRAVEYELRGHRRTVTDVNFSPNKPDLVATCSIDTTINIWDLRSPSGPKQTFADFVAGASRARLSAFDPHLIYSSHDNRLVLWDDRMNNRPLLNFVAHDGKINSLRFYDYNGKPEVITGSTDRSVKLWDLTGAAKEEPVIELRTAFPVWRVVEAPKSSGVLVVPLRGGENRVFAIDMSTIPHGKHSWPDVVQEFGGHEAPVREALWRRCNTEQGYDVVTWSRDGHLRLLDFGKAPGAKDLGPPPRRDYSFHLEPQGTHKNFQENRGCYRLPVFTRPLKNANAQLDWIAGVQLKSPAGSSFPPPLNRSATSTSLSLASRRGPDYARFSREVTLVSSKFPNIRFESVDVAAGLCTLTLRGPWGSNDAMVGLRVQVTAPPEYPWVPLKCDIEEDPSVPAAVFANIDAFLETSMSELASRGQPAFEVCLRYLMGESVSLDNIEDLDDAIDSTDEDISEELEADEDSAEEALSDDSDSDIDMSSPMPGKPAIDSTPLPKNCGCVWSASGVLVCFFNRQVSQRDRGPMPLDRIFAGSDSDSDSYGSDSEGSFLDTNPGPNWSVTAARLTAKSLNRVSGATSDNLSTEFPSENDKEAEHIVWLQDMKHLMPCRPDIASEYRTEFGGDPCELATHNAAVAEKYDRHEDSYFWRLLERFLITDRSFGGVTYDWSEHPFGSRGLLKDIALHLEKKQNYQLLAGLACIIALYHKPDITSAQPMEETTETLYRLEMGWDGTVQTNMVAHRKSGPRDGAVLSPWQSAGDKGAALCTGRHNSEVSGISPGTMSMSGSSLNLLSQPSSPPTQVGPSSKFSEVSVQIRTDKSFDYEYFDDNSNTDGYIDWVPSVIHYRRLYAAMLAAWNLDIKRLEQLKFNNAELTIRVPDADHRIWADARRATCLLCERPARTQVAVCGVCSHVMHRQCAEQWWKTASECPSGCGCYCLDDL